MKRFKPGQQVVCTHPTGMWLGVFPGPKMGEIVTINKYSDIHEGYVELLEYNFSSVGNRIPDCYGEWWFEALADLKELQDESNIYIQRR